MTSDDQIVLGCCKQDQHMPTFSNILCIDSYFYQSTIFLNPQLCHYSNSLATASQSGPIHKGSRKLSIYTYIIYIYKYKLILYIYVSKSYLFFWGTTFSCFQKILIWNSKGLDRQRQRVRESFHLLAHFLNFHKLQHWVRPNPEAGNSISVSQMGGRDWNILYCFSRRVSRELDWKQSSWDPNPQLLWDAVVADDRLNWCTTTPPLLLCFG